MDMAAGVRDMVGMAVCDRQSRRRRQRRSSLVLRMLRVRAATVVSAANRVDDGRRDDGDGRQGKEKGNLRTSVAAVALLVEPADRHLGFFDRCCGGRTRRLQRQWLRGC